MSGRLRLAAAAALFFGWLALLGYAALTKSRAPTVSRAQAAGAAVALRVKLAAGADGRPDPRGEVVECLTPGGPAPGTAVAVLYLGGATGFAGPGEYLLLVNPVAATDATPTYALAGPQRSPGGSAEGTGGDRVYPWSPEVEAQARRLFPAK